MLIPLISKHDIEIHRSVCMVNNDGTLPLVINNLSNKQLHLNKNMKLGRLESDIDIHANKSVREIRRRELKN